MDPFLLTAKRNSLWRFLTDKYENSSCTETAGKTILFQPRAPRVIEPANNILLFVETEKLIYFGPSPRCPGVRACVNDLAVPCCVPRAIVSTSLPPPEKLHFFLIFCVSNRNMFLSLPFGCTLGLFQISGQRRVWGVVWFPSPALRPPPRSRPRAPAQLRLTEQRTMQASKAVMVSCY